jgi:hypothetical protein
VFGAGLQLQEQFHLMFVLLTKHPDALVII